MVKNNFSLTGHLGQDVELKETSSGKSYCRLSVAVSQRYKDESGDVQQKTNWFNLTLWEKRAEKLSKYLKKGTLVQVVGELRTKQIEDPDSGKKYSTVELKLVDIEMLGGKPKSED